MFLLPDNMSNIIEINFELLETGILFVIALVMFNLHSLVLLSNIG